MGEITSREYTKAVFKIRVVKEGSFTRNLSIEGNLHETGDGSAVIRDRWEVIHHLYVDMLVRVDAINPY